MNCTVPIIVTALIVSGVFLLLKHGVSSDPDRVSSGWLQGNRYSKDGDKLC